MVKQLEFGDISVDVLFKDIKNVHLSVYPPTGRVRISAPERMNLDTVRVFAISKLDWIKSQHKKLEAQEREAPREFLERESHYLWGNRYLLELQIEKGKSKVDITHKKIIISSPKALTQERLRMLMDKRYRAALRERASDLVMRWESKLEVQVKQIFIQRMKTKWGSCNASARNIRLNLELAKKAPECLEYIVLHEMLHLFVPNHGPKFIQLMDHHMPHWRQVRQNLNATPLSHVDWTY